MSQALLWNKIEAQKSKTGALPQEGSRNDEVYQAWIRDCDARKAQALLIENSGPSEIDHLLKIRALLFRGELQEADVQIRKYASENSTDDEAVYEARLEQARLSAYEGNWRQCHELTLQALQSRKLESLSYLSSLQVHALACFELGDFSEALKSLETADALSSIYPYSISSHYAKVLRGRLLARAQGITTALAWIDRIWNEIRQNPSSLLNADFVHAIVFASIDIFKYAKVTGQLSQIDQASRLQTLVLASFALTEVTGERLYSSLACIDAAMCGPSNTYHWFRQQASQARKEFERINKLFNALDSREASSTSEATFVSLMPPTHDELKINQEQIQAPKAISHLLDLNHRWVFQLKPWKAADLSEHEQVVLALQCLTQTGVRKEELFNSVWGNARYTPRLHDASIHYVLSRIKKLTGIRFRTRDGMIEAPEGILSL